MVKAEPRDAEGFTKLMLAAKEGDCQLIKQLIQQGAWVNETHTVFGTALTLAAAEGKLQAVKVLSEHKADLEHSSHTHGFTPLLAACQNGHPDVVALLLALKADASARTKSGITAAMMLCVNDPPLPDTLALCARQGAASLDSMNKHGMTALMIAARNNQLWSTQILLDSGANVKIKAADGSTAIKLATEPAVLSVLYAAASKRKAGRGLAAGFECHEVLGVGGFGAVRKAYRLRDRLPVAVKVIKLAGLTAEHRALIDKEVAIMSQIKHENCVELIEVLETPKKRYLVMELCFGDLRERLARGPLAEAEARHVALGIAKALQHLHSRGIVHRDVKLENVMMGEGDTPKLADFGLAKVSAGEDMRTSCGTPTYAAPELLCAAGYGPAVDLWALGVVFYTLLCGFPPFFHENGPALFGLIKKGEFSFAASDWARVSEDSKAVIRSLLVLDPARRASPEQVVQALQPPAVVMHV